MLPFPPPRLPIFLGIVDRADFPSTIVIQSFQIVGRGAFGVVHKAKWRGKIVAAKTLEGDNEQNAFTIEVSVAFKSS